MSDQARSSLVQRAWRREAAHHRGDCRVALFFAITASAAIDRMDSSLRAQRGNPCPVLVHREPSVAMPICDPSSPPLARYQKTQHAGI